MKNIKELSILGVAAVIILGVFASDAAAMKVGGAAAKAISDSDTSCANYAYGSLTNSCATTRSFILPLTFDSAGNKALSFRAQGAAATNNVGCKGTAVLDNGSLYTTPTVYLSQFGSMQDVSLGTLYVPGTGPVYMNCSIDNGGKLFLASWDE